MVQGPLVALLMIIPFAIFSMYKIDRFRHQAIIAELENR
jgi:Na+/melibiose symporter-like transporter